MRARVESTWRTKLLLLFAFVVAGVIAWNRVQTRLAEEAEERANVRTVDPAEFGDCPRSGDVPESPDVVDIEIVAQ